MAETTHNKTEASNRLTPEVICNRLEKIALEAFDQTPVLFAYLFGSYAKGLAHRFSDLDIAVFVPPQDTRSTYRLEMGLGLKFDALLDYRVSADVRTLHTLPIAVVGEIVTFGRLIFSRDEAARVDFEVLARKRYFDFKPVLDNYYREILKSIATR